MRDGLIEVVVREGSEAHEKIQSAMAKAQRVLRGPTSIVMIDVEFSLTEPGLGKLIYGPHANVLVKIEPEVPNG